MPPGYLSSPTEAAVIFTPLLTIWSTPTPEGDLVTEDGVQVTAIPIDMLEDGVMTLIVNSAAANADGTDWAIWLIAPVVAARTLGVLTVPFPGGPQAPALAAGPTSAAWTLEFVPAPGPPTRLLIRVMGAAGVTIKWSVRAGANINTARAIGG
jgi:hypothetical protein